MKSAVIVFVLALALSCLHGTSTMPSYPQKCGIMRVEQLPETSGMKREESIIPDMTVSDGYRPMSYMTNVVDSPGRHTTDFPWPQMQ
jgi:hypothetical protein